MEKIENER